MYKYQPPEGKPPTEPASQRLHPQALQSNSEMSAKLRVILLAIALSIYEVSASSLTEPRCRCLKITSNFIPIRHFSHIEIIPKSAYCSKAEIIIVYRHKHTICLDPEAKWVKKYVSAVISQAKENVTQGTE